MEIILFGSFLILLFIGVPVGFSMGLSAMATIVYMQGMKALLPTSGIMYASMASETLLAIPFFILAGVIMEVTGISARLIELADACFGHLKGGIALTTIVAALVFSSISGSGPATVAALGGILIPALAKHGYRKRHAASLVASAGEMGIVLPPSIAFIVFAVVASEYERISISRLFLAGIVPGILLAVAFYLVARFLPLQAEGAKTTARSHVDRAIGRGRWPVMAAFGRGNRSGASVGSSGEVGGSSRPEHGGGTSTPSTPAGAGGGAASAAMETGRDTLLRELAPEPVPGSAPEVAEAAEAVMTIRTQRASSAEIRKAFLRALPGLLMPVIILGGIYGGIFTPTESAAVAAVYALLVGLVVSRDVKLKDLFRIFTQAGVQSARIMFIVAAATVFAYAITKYGVAENIAHGILSITTNTVLIILFINVVLLIAGMFLDAISAFYLFVPLFVPVLLEVGMDMTSIGVMMTVNLALGLVTPPVGIDLFVAAGIAKIPFGEAVKGIWPFFGAGLVVLMLITFVPAVSNFLPNLLGS
ncbi:TRAP transporter large permease [Galactobacter valiniphilus]|uniref:TRAP transporter large permease n=1 Tax=Galactobacter valiniphilus TaxID=2676122 RepID=UPI0037360CDA